MSRLALPCPCLLLPLCARVPARPARRTAAARPTAGGRREKGTRRATQEEECLQLRTSCGIRGSRQKSGGPRAVSAASERNGVSCEGESAVAIGWLVHHTPAYAACAAHPSRRKSCYIPLLLLLPPPSLPAPRRATGEREKERTAAAALLLRLGWLWSLGFFQAIRPLL